MGENIYTSYFGRSRSEHRGCANRGFLLVRLLVLGRVEEEEGVGEHIGGEKKCDWSEDMSSHWRE